MGPNRLHIVPIGPNTTIDAMQHARKFVTYAKLRILTLIQTDLLRFFKKLSRLTFIYHSVCSHSPCSQTDWVIRLREHLFSDGTMSICVKCKHMLKHVKLHYFLFFEFFSYHHFIYTTVIF